MNAAGVDWPTIPLGAVADIKTGPFGSSLHQSDYQQVGTPIVTVEHLGERGLTHQAIPLVGDSDAGRLSAYRCQPGDILFSRVGSVDRNSLVGSAENGWLFSGRLLRVRADRRRVHPPFLSFQFATEWFKDSVRAVAVGQTMASLNTTILSRLHVRLPDLPTQRAIAEKLAATDDYVAALQRMIAKKEHIKLGVMQELLTGKTRLPGFTGAWNARSLGDLARIKTGSRDNQDKVPGGRFPFFVRSAKVERIDTYSYDCEAVLVPGEGGIGSIFHYVDGKFEAHQRVYKISDFSTDASGKFIYHYMRQFFGAHAMKHSVKATVDSLRLPTFKSFSINLPKNDEQRSIAAVLDSAEREISVLRAQLSKARDIKQGMMQDLLPGRTRLPFAVVAS